MTFKKLLACILALILCVTLTACGGNGGSIENGFSTLPTNTEQTPVPQSNGPLLYRVTDAAGHVTWLFGSIHVGTDDFYPLPDYVLQAFDGADSLAVEYDIIKSEADMAAQMQLMRYMMYPYGNSIRSHIPAALYQDAVEILTENGMYMPTYDQFLPMVWVSLVEELQLQALGLDSSLGVDRHLIKRAYEQTKEVLDIESADFQVAMLMGFSEPLQVLMLESAVESYRMTEEAKKQLNDLIAAWRKGDEAALAESLSTEAEGLTAEEQVLYDEYVRQMYTERNLSMTAYAEQALRSGKEVFICVGAAHVIGDDGMAQQLAARGYTVERVTG